jgi:hypothetical protein
MLMAETGADDDDDNRQSKTVVQTIQKGLLAGENKVLNGSGFFKHQTIRSR